MPSLTPKQELFVAEYLKDFNATQAAIRTGYSAKTAQVQGSRLLSNAMIAEAVEKGRNKLTEKAGITAQRVLEEIGRIAFSDVRSLYDTNGHLKDIHELDDDTAATIAGIEIEVERGKTKSGEEETVITRTHKIKRWDKNRALDTLAKHFGLVKEKIEHSGPDGGPIPIDDKEAARKLAFILARADKERQ